MDLQLSLKYPGGRAAVPKGDVASVFSIILTASGRGAAASTFQYGDRRRRLWTTSGKTSMMRSTSWCAVL